MIFVDSERKNEFNGNIATYRSESYYASYYSFDNFLVEKSHFFNLRFKRLALFLQSFLSKLWS